MKKIVGPAVGVGAALAYSSISMPLKRRRYSPPRARCAIVRASSDTAHLTVSFFATQRVSGTRYLYAALSPAAWNVPTIGQLANNAVVTVGPGASGSCRCSTSKSSSRSALIVRSAAAGSGASGAIEPLADVAMLLPRGVTPASGGGPSHGASSRASWPSLRSARGPTRALGSGRPLARSGCRGIQGRRAPLQGTGRRCVVRMLRTADHCGALPR